ncbi:MAG TPA: hypothetical protein VGO03_11090 [Acidimicrobiia bacterium]|jgi:restriction system protein
MAKKRGFLAELQRQSAQAQRQRQQAATLAARNQARAARDYAAAQRAALQAQAQAARTAAANQKAAAAEAQRAHDAALIAQAESLNADLASQVADLESLLAATLDVDDFVDVEKLRRVAEHPLFARADLEVPLPPPAPIQASPEPQYVEPPAAHGLFGKKKHQEAVAAAQAEHARLHADWAAEAATIPGAQLGQMQQHQAAEQQRLMQLAAAREAYANECGAREAEVERQNADLDDFIRGLAANDEEAVQEYVALVLANSVYPDCFPVEHEHHFDAPLRELTLCVAVPAPSTMPTVKEHKYVKAKGEVQTTQLSDRAQKDRYTSAIHQVALRTLHEVFEADREGKIQTITLLVTTDDINKATGRREQVDLLAVAVDRETFLTFDLSNVVPRETLRLLKATVSKDPFGLAAIDTSKGVRG